MCIGVVDILEYIHDTLRHLGRHEVAVGWTHALLVSIDLSLSLARTQAIVTFIYSKLLQALVGVSPWWIANILAKPVLSPSNQLVQVVHYALDEDDGLDVWQVEGAKAVVAYVILSLCRATWMSAIRLVVGTTLYASTRRAFVVA